MIKKFLDFSLGQILVFVLNLFTYPIITRIFLPEEMGKYSMSITMISLAQSICMIGMDQVFVRYFYEENEITRGGFFKKCIQIPCILSMGVGIICMVFYKNCSRYIIGEISRKFVLLFVIQILFTVLLNFFLLNIRMQQRARLYSNICILQKVVYVMCAIGIAALSKKANYMILVYANTLGIVVAGMVAQKKSGFLLFNNSTIKHKTKMKAALKYGMPFVFSASIFWLFHSVDKIMLKMFSGYYEVGIYTGAMAIVNIINVVQGAFTVYWTPVAFERYSKYPEDRMFFSKVNGIVSFFMLGIAILVIFFKDIIVLFLGEPYEEAVFALPYLTFVPVMYTISETTVVGINFKEKSYFHILIAAISTICNVIGNWIMVPRYGARGAAIATGLSYMVFFAARTYFSLKCYKVQFKLLKLGVCCVNIYILAVYASFHKFNIIYFLLGIGNLIVLFVCYFDIFKLVVDRVKKVILK